MILQVLTHRVVFASPCGCNRFSKLDLSTPSLSQDYLTGSVLQNEVDLAQQTEQPKAEISLEGHTTCLFVNKEVDRSKLEDL